MKTSIKSTSFRYNSSFFFHITKYKSFIDYNKSNKGLLPTNEE